LIFIVLSLLKIFEFVPKQRKKSRFGTNSAIAKHKNSASKSIKKVEKGIKTTIKKFSIKQSSIFAA